jgi:hypothetical protein
VRYFANWHPRVLLTLHQLWRRPLHGRSSWERNGDVSHKLLSVQGEEKVATGLGVGGKEENGVGGALWLGGDAGQEGGSGVLLGELSSDVVDKRVNRDIMSDLALTRL